LKVKFIPKTSKYYYRFVLTILFLVIGFIISGISIFVSTYYQINSINKEFSDSAKRTATYKKDFLYQQTDNFRHYITSIDTTPEFNDFIQTDPRKSTHTKEHITSVMMAIAHSNPNIMQFRFIGKEGCEAIRVDRDSVGATPYELHEKTLQNKSDRYYFKETKSLTHGKVWFSKLDLNMEHGQIEEPIVPVLRVAKAYYHNNKFRGILIINIFMEKILDEIMESELFNVALIDKNLFLLSNNLRGYEKNNKEWTKYLNPKKDIKYSIDHTMSEYKNNFILNNFFAKKHYIIELSDTIDNNENLKIILEEKTEKLLEHTQDIAYYITVMSIIVFIISFPIALLLSKYPLRLHENLTKVKEDLENQLEVIDQYVYMSSTNLAGNITDVSTAFSRLCGYSKDELIGVNHRILKDPNTPKVLYKKMWVSILRGKNWTGMLKNIHKDGSAYWIINHISPIIEKGKTVGFTSIRENITDLKHVEEISIKDELTQAYNRRFFKQMFPKELHRAKRSNNIFCIAMLDIDYFKKYNDTYGHLKGDEALQKVVQQLMSKLQRAADYLFRVGGEEFIIIYTEQSFEESKKFASNLVNSIEELNIEHKTSECCDYLTISLGLLNVRPNCSKSEEEVLQRVDELLYEAKDTGRKKVVAGEC